MNNEKQILLKAIEADPCIIKSASERMRNDKEVMVEVVKRSGCLLKHASAELQNDKDIVIQAVSNGGESGALQWASKTLKDDREVVLTAIKSNAYEIMHASDRLKLNSYIIASALFCFKYQEYYIVKYHHILRDRWGNEVFE